jgi:hypothetical protein
MIEEAVKKTLCENCGRELKGRSDKRFCDDSCRNTFNHRKRIPDNDIMSPTINILKKNRGILFQLLEQEKRTVLKETLFELGFNFKYCTDHRTLEGVSYYFSFDVGYQKEKEGKYYLMTADYFNFLVEYFLEGNHNLKISEVEKEEIAEMIWEPEDLLRINSERIDLSEKEKKFSTL